MVQRCDDDDLGRRFSRVERVKLDRRRREKNELPPPPVIQETYGRPERCRRVLFEPDQNLQGWIDGELCRISETRKKEWNFDFKQGQPANIPNHKWQWERVVKRRVQPRMTAVPWSSCRSGVGVKGCKITKPTSSKIGASFQKKITDYMNQCKYPKASTSTINKEPTKPMDTNDAAEENIPDITSK